MLANRRYVNLQVKQRSCKAELSSRLAAGVCLLGVFADLADPGPGEVAQDGEGLRAAAGCHRVDELEQHPAVTLALLDQAPRERRGAGVVFEREPGEQAGGLGPEVEPR